MITGESFRRRTQPRAPPTPTQAAASRPPQSTSPRPQASRRQEVPGAASLRPLSVRRHQPWLYLSSSIGIPPNRIPSGQTAPPKRTPAPPSALNDPPRATTWGGCSFGCYRSWRKPLTVLHLNQRGHSDAKLPLDRRPSVPTWTCPGTLVHYRLQKFRQKVWFDASDFD